MSDLDALLAGIVADSHNVLRWLVMADWLEDHGFPERAELVRVHRELLRTCTDPDAHPERPQLHARMMELMRAGVQPCLPQKTLTLPGGVELRMSFIPPGSFLMGSPETEDGREEHETQHLVTLTKGYWLGQTPVTQGQWRAVIGTDPSYFKGDELPVESVSWDDARAFCAAMTELGARLPTEAEWEWASRSGTTTPFHWGGDLDGTQANCNGKGPYGSTENGPFRRMMTTVGTYTEVSPHPWRLEDMIGNVSEWCGMDFLGQNPDGLLAIRGGSWRADASYCRAAARDLYLPDESDDHLGFRLAAKNRVPHHFPA